MFKKYFYSLIMVLLSLILFSKNKTESNSLYFPIHSKYNISSYYGYRTLKYYHFHNGIDIALKHGTPLYSLSSGVVTFTGYISGYGHSIIISYYNGYKSLYGHISPKYIVNTGDKVNPNELVAHVGPKYLENGKLNGFTTRFSSSFYYI